MNELATIIEKWFVNHDGDGDFVGCDRLAPYTVIGPTRIPGKMVFATKPKVVSSAIYDYAGSTKIGLIARCGLPDKADIPWIRKIVEKQKLYFLGDMDPVDLLVFAWLRLKLRPKKITYLGVSDVFLAANSIHSIVPSVTIAHSASEWQSIGVLKKVLPDYRELIGPKCAKLLERRHKFELEAVVSADQRSGPMLQAIDLIDGSANDY